jgi:hypothetical protein
VTKPEWKKLAALYTAIWPRAALSDSSVEAWFVLLGSFPAADVGRAIYALGQSSALPPAAAEIIDQIRSTRASLAAAEALKEVEAKRRKKYARVADQVLRLRAGGQ